jgi:SAM-dependent methyltransferase
VAFGVGVDLSLAMLEAARRERGNGRFGLVQGDATRLPLRSEAFDTVAMMGGIHHVPDRRRLFSEIARVLRPGGRLLFREPADDLFAWRWLRMPVYRLSPGLDARHERPLRRRETEEALESAGLSCDAWETYGFLGFCLFMNSDILVFNRAFARVPGIDAVTRWGVRADDAARRLPGLSGAGLQVVGRAVKRGLAEGARRG